MGSTLTIINILFYITLCILIFTLVVIVFYTIMLFFSFVHFKKDYRLDEKKEHRNYHRQIYSKAVSIIVPAYNEEINVIQSIRSFFCLKYPRFEIIVVNDGSTDHTLPLLIEHFKMVKINKINRKHIQTKEIIAVYKSTLLPNLILIDKINGGKSDALNAGINYSKYSYLCSVDADSILESDSLLMVMKPIIDSNEEIIASGGSVRIANGCHIQMGHVLNVGLSKKKIVVMQVIEYLRAFLMGRVGLSRSNLVLVNSGAFSVFSTSAVIEAGGYSTNTVGEDMELVVRLHRMIYEKKLNKRINFVPKPVCWTEAPETIKDLRMQRRRWHQGLLESLWEHKNLTLNPKYGKVGMIAFPYFWIIELIGPVIELMGYVITVILFFRGDIYFELAILILVLLVLYGSLFSLIAVLFELWSVKKYKKQSDIAILFLYSLTETFWYRPLTTIWRCEGIFRWLIGKKNWDKLDRKGMDKAGELFNK